MTAQQLAELGVEPGDVAVVAEWLAPGDDLIPDDLDDLDDVTVDDVTVDDVRVILPVRQVPTSAPSGPWSPPGSAHDERFDPLSAWLGRPNAANGNRHLIVRRMAVVAAKISATLGPVGARDRKRGRAR